MSDGLSRKAGLALAVLGALGISRAAARRAPAGRPPAICCCSPGRQFRPPAKTTIADVYCPAVEIPEGGSVLQAFSGGRVGDAGRASQPDRPWTDRPRMHRPARRHDHSSGSASRAARSSGVGRFARPLRRACQHRREERLDDHRQPLAPHERRRSRRATPRAASRSSRRASSFRRGDASSSKSRLASAAACRRGAAAADARLEVTLGQGLRSSCPLDQR